MAVIVIVAGLALWICCLTVLWGWAVDASGVVALLTVLSFFAVCWLCLLKRVWLIAWACRLLRGLKLDQLVPLDDALAGKIGSSKDDAQKRMRLLAAASLWAVACFIAATVMVPLADFVVGLLGHYFLFSRWTWRLIETGWLLGGAVLVAMGLVPVAFATKVVRSGGGRDVYAACYRDWVLAVSLAFAVFAVAWWFGANLIFLVFSIAGVIGFSAVTAVSRGELATHPRKKLLPFGPPPVRARLNIAAAHGMLLLVVLVQLRLLGDVFSLSMTRRMLWVFLSLGLLSYFLVRVDRKSRPPGRGQISGSVLGIGAAMLAQAGQMVLCLNLPADGFFQQLFNPLVLPLAVGTQLPIAALAATLLSHQRKTFAIAGGSVGSYVTAVFGGLAVAMGVYVILGILGFGWAWMVAVVLAAMLVLAGGADGARHTHPTSKRVQWAAWSVVLCGSFVAGLWSALDRASAATGAVQTGSWLTARVQEVRWRKQFRQFGVLPMKPSRRSDVVTDCLAGIFERRRGKWWMACTAAADLPAELPAQLYAMGSNPQPPDVPRRLKRRWPPLSYSDSNYFRYSRLNSVGRLGCDYYDGIFLAPLPADHPQAWRCYNAKLMRRCMQLAKIRHPEWNEQLKKHVWIESHGVVCLRTQAGPDRVRQALNVARTYHNAVRTGWAVAAVTRRGIDLLLIGPDEALGGDEKSDIMDFLRERTSNEPDVYLVKISELWEPYPGVSDIRQYNPPGERLRDTPHVDGLRNYLDKTRKVRLLQRQQGQ